MNSELTPGYFSFAMKNDRHAIMSFFKGVMDRSDIPVMIYNFPWVLSPRVR